ncbi:MAG: Asd/ArgC dimerization domain-containing protein, partial [Thermoplasmatota archaeon]
MDSVRVGVAGATGYLGAELLRILAAHPNVELATLASSSKAGTRVSDELPQFRRVLEHTLVKLEAAAFADCDFVFLATPTGVARALAPALLAQGNRVIDLSGDHRLVDAALSTKHYGAVAPALARAVYGLPEANRRATVSADLVANPGCYATASALALLPLFAGRRVEPRSAVREGGDVDASAASGRVATRVIVDAKSGVSGAGREPSDEFHFPEMNEGMHAYKVGTHRHQPEIAQTLATAAGVGVEVTFTPHVVPLNR